MKEQVSGVSPEVAMAETKLVRVKDVMISIEEEYPGLPEEKVHSLQEVPVEKVLEDVRTYEFDKTIGFQIGKQAYGAIKIDGKFVPFTTPAYDHSPMAWIDAEIHTLAQAKEELEYEKIEFKMDRETRRDGHSLEERDLIISRRSRIRVLEGTISRMEEWNLDKAVKTRFGIWHPFKEGQLIVSSKQT